VVLMIALEGEGMTAKQIVALAGRRFTQVVADYGYGRGCVNVSDPLELPEFPAERFRFGRLRGAVVPPSCVAFLQELHSVLRRIA
jgi:hypothetical protein